MIEVAKRVLMVSKVEEGEGVEGGCSGVLMAGEERVLDELDRLESQANVGGNLQRVSDEKLRSNQNP